MTDSEITKLTLDELRAILLTCDGRGRETKEKALVEIIGRYAPH